MNWIDKDEESSNQGQIQKQNQSKIKKSKGDFMIFRLWVVHDYSWF